MAKKKRLIGKAVEEEEYVFTPPDFDEREFILKDLYSTKILLVTSMLSVIVGVLASCINSAWEWYGGLALIVLAAAVLKQVLMIFRFNTDLIDKKSMIGNYALFVLLALGVWILMINTIITV